MATPKIRREQVAGMNIHYVNYSLDYFLDAQQRIGFKSIELWCAAPHVWLDHMRYYDAKEIRQKIESRGLAVHVLTPENCTYPYQFAAKEPEHIERSFGYFSNGIRLANELAQRGHAAPPGRSGEGKRHHPSDGIDPPGRKPACHQP